MWDIIISLSEGSRRQEGLRGLVKQVEHGTKDGLHAAVLGRGERRGDLEAGELDEGVSDACELPLDSVGDGREGRRRVRLKLALRVGEKLLLVAFVRNAERTE